jgi:hypothetical protein
MKNQDKSPIDIRWAIIIGQLFVNVPVIVISVGLIFLGIIGAIFTPILLVVLSILGIVLGWAWWSFAVPRWRRWALNRGAPADELQLAGVASGLLWPKGSFFEKTEFKIKDKK